jgi:hypothetical protein
MPQNYIIRWLLFNFLICDEILHRKTPFFLKKNDKLYINVVHTIMCNVMHNLLIGAFPLKTLLIDHVVSIQRMNSNILKIKL